MQYMKDLDNAIYAELPSDKVTISALSKLLSKQYIYLIRYNFFGSLVHEYSIDYAIGMGSYLLTKGEVANYLYDSVLDLCSVTKETAGVMTEHVVRFVQKTPLKSFALDSLKAICNAPSVEYSYLLRRVIAITLDLYNRDYIVNVDVPLAGCSGTLKPAMFLGAFAATTEERHKYIRDRMKIEKPKHNFNVLDLSICWTKKELQIVRDKLNLMYSHLVQEMIKIPLNEIQDTIACGIDAASYNMVDALFYNGSWAGVPQHYARYYYIGGQMKNERSDASTSLFECGITRQFYSIAEKIGVDCLRNRKVFLREKGVIINLVKPLFVIKSILLQESHDEENDIHLLRIVYYAPSTNCDSEIDFAHGFTVNMKDIRMSGSFYGENDCVVLMAVLKWLGIPIDLQSDDIFSGVSKDIDSAIQEDNLHYEEPISWNYDKKGCKLNINPSSGCYLIEKRTVGRYTRRLPIGEKASPEAVALARRVFMELKPGYTIVDKFERNQVVKKLRLEE